MQLKWVIMQAVRGAHGQIVKGRGVNFILSRICRVMIDSKEYRNI